MTQCHFIYEAGKRDHSKTKCISACHTVLPPGGPSVLPPIAHTAHLSGDDWLRAGVQTEVDLSIDDQRIDTELGPGLRAELPAGLHVLVQQHLVGVDVLQVPAEGVALKPLTELLTGRDITSLRKLTKRRQTDQILTKQTRWSMNTAALFQHQRNLPLKTNVYFKE